MRIEITKVLPRLVVAIALSTGTAALADDGLVTKTIDLTSAQGTSIFVSAQVRESAPIPGNYGQVLKNRVLESFSVSARGGDVRDYSRIRAVLVLACSALHYPNSWNYNSHVELDLFQSSGGAPLSVFDTTHRTLERVGTGGDHDSCRTELALVVDGVWQVDPINGSTNFILNLKD